MHLSQGLKPLLCISIISNVNIWLTKYDLRCLGLSHTSNDPRLLWFISKKLETNLSFISIKAIVILTSIVPLRYIFLSFILTWILPHIIYVTFEWPILHWFIQVLGVIYSLSFHWTHNLWECVSYTNYNYPQLSFSLRKVA